MIILWIALVVPSIVYWVIGLLIVVPRVLPVVWQRLVELTPAAGAAVAAGRVAEATLDVADLILLVLPWVGSLLLLIMIVRWPVEAMLTLLGSTAASTCGVVAVVARARGRGGPRPGAGGGPIAVPEHPYQLIIPSSDPSDRGARLMR